MTIHAQRFAKGVRKFHYQVSLLPLPFSTSLNQTVPKIYYDAQVDYFRRGPTDIWHTFPPMRQKGREGASLSAVSYRNFWEY